MTHVVVVRNMEIKKGVREYSERAVTQCGELQDVKHILVGCSETKIWKISKDQC
jgi:hypothetical protein